MMSRTTAVLIAILAFSVYWGLHHQEAAQAPASSATEQPAKKVRESRAEMQERFSKEISAPASKFVPQTSTIFHNGQAQSEIPETRQDSNETHMQKICYGVNATRPECQMISTQ